MLPEGKSMKQRAHFHFHPLRSGL